MSNLTVLVFLVAVFVVAQHGLAVRNVTTTDSIGKKDENNELTVMPHYFAHTETHADGREAIVNSSLQDRIRLPRHTRHVHRRHRHRHARITKYIVNGLPARKGQFPYQVAIHQKSDMAFLRNGAIISARHVLSTAWSFCKARGEKKRAPQDLEVHAGMVRLHARDLEVFDVQDTLCHEQYNPPDNEVHGLVLIRTTKPFVFSAAVQRIDLSTKRYGGGLDVTISGWGGTTAGETGKSQVSEHLQYGDTFTLSLEDCRQRLKREYRIDNFLGEYRIDNFLFPGTGCTHSFDPSGGPYTRAYDGGAPVVHRGRLLGIVTLVYQEAQIDGYVSVAHHLDWISRQVTRVD